jgi:hypothetical protein
MTVPGATTAKIEQGASRQRPLPGCALMSNVVLVRPRIYLPPVAWATAVGGLYRADLGAIADHSVDDMLVRVSACRSSHSMSDAAA